MNRERMSSASRLGGWISCIIPALGKEKSTQPGERIGCLYECMWVKEN